MNFVRTSTQRNRSRRIRKRLKARKHSTLPINAKRSRVSRRNLWRKVGDDWAYYVKDVH